MNNLMTLATSRRFHLVLALVALAALVTGCEGDYSDQFPWT